MNPLFLGLAAGGIVIIVMLHYVLGQTKTREMPQEQEIRDRFHAAIGETPEALALCQTMAFALDRESQQIWVLFVHGLHLNLRSYGRSSIRSLRIQGPPLCLDLRIRSFDRGRFCDTLREDQQAQAARLCETVASWGAA